MSHNQFSTCLPDGTASPLLSRSFFFPPFDILLYLPLLASMAPKCEICGAKTDKSKKHFNQVHGNFTLQEEPTHYEGIGYVCPKTTCSWFGGTLDDYKVWFEPVI